MAEPASVGASSERVASALPEAASAVATASTAATEGAAATTGTGSAAATAAESPPPAVAPDTTAPLEEVRSAVPSIRSASAQTGAVVDRAVETVARTVSETAPGDLPVQRTLPPDLHPLQVAGEALRRSPPALLPASAVKSSPSTAAQPATGKASPLPTLWEAPGVLPSSASALAHEQAGRLGLGASDGVHMPHSVRRGRIDPLRFFAPGTVRGPAGGSLSQPPAAAVGTSPGAVGGHSGDLAPPDGHDPMPSPGSLAAAASGSGGSSLVPIAALLALLALAAPAILRRLGEGPGLRAPPSFVCALDAPASGVTGNVAGNLARLGGCRQGRREPE